MDIVMLHHELMESRLMAKQGLIYDEAHSITETKCDYSKYVRKLEEEGEVHE